MLKNVAIPLMLAASEAEAQRDPSKGELRDALAGDMMKEFAGLQADAAACTVASSAGADNIANNAQALVDAQGVLAEAEGAVTALIAADGAWGQANTAREAAVAAAVASEAESGIAGLLDDLDTAMDAERAAAQAFLDADKAFQVGGLRVTAAIARDGDANTATTGRRAVLLAAKTAATDAVQAVTDQIAKETLWRKWRYCELGAAVAGVALSPDASGDWW